MKLAYIILAYKNPAQLVRLVHTLNAPGASFFIHVDKKTHKDVYRRMADPLHRLANVHFLARLKCHWGSFNLVKAAITGVFELIRSDVPFDYALLLSGQDYPLKRTVDIERFFADEAGKLFMSYYPLPRPAWGPEGGLDRVRYRHFRLYDAYYRALPVKRRFPQGFQPFGGSAYWSLPRAAVEYLESFIRDNPEFVAFFKRVYIPDEVFFQTILLNSAFKETIVNDDLRYIEWQETDGHPAILTTHDFENLASSPQLFARKFDVAKDADILTMIDRELLGAEPAG